MKGDPSGAPPWGDFKEVGQTRGPGKNKDTRTLALGRGLTERSWNLRTLVEKVLQPPWAWTWKSRPLWIRLLLAGVVCAAGSLGCALWHSSLPPDCL